MVLTLATSPSQGSHRHDRVRHGLFPRRRAGSRIVCPAAVNRPVPTCAMRQDPRRLRGRYRNRSPGNFTVTAPTRTPTNYGPDGSNGWVKLSAYAPGMARYRPRTRPERPAAQGSTFAPRSLGAHPQRQPVQRRKRRGKPSHVEWHRGCAVQAVQRKIKQPVRLAVPRHDLDVAP